MNLVVKYFVSRIQPWKVFTMNQKDEEKLIIQHFRKKWPDFPKGRLVPSESPDFILKISPRRSIGIELTRMEDDRDPVAAILKALQKKEEKIPNYTHMHLSELWLIIHADDVFDRISYNFESKIGNLRIPGSFQRVFLFDLFSNRIVDIQLKSINNKGLKG